MSRIEPTGTIVIPTEAPVEYNWWAHQGWAPPGGVFTEQPVWENVYGTVVSPTPYTPPEVSVVPLPPAIWLFGTAMFALVCIARRKK